MELFSQGVSNLRKSIQIKSNIINGLSQSFWVPDHIEKVRQNNARYSNIKTNQFAIRNENITLKRTTPQNHVDENDNIDERMYYINDHLARAESEDRINMMSTVASFFFSLILLGFITKILLIQLTNEPKLLTFNRKEGTVPHISR